MAQLQYLTTLAVIVFSLHFSQPVTALGISDREMYLQLGPRDRGPPEAGLFEMKQSGDAALGSMPLSGRDLLASWLGKRDCIDSGYTACVSK